VANPKKENGYTPISNEILDNMHRAGLNGTQWLIVTCIWRYTYGFNRKAAPMSLSFISEQTGICARNVKKQVTSLLDRNILLEVSPASFSQAREIAFNKNYEEWINPSTQDSAQGAAQSGGGQTAQTTGGQSAPQKRKHKENNNNSAGARKYLQFFTDNIGVISPTIVTEAETYITDDSLPDELVVLALKHSVDSGAKNWKYAKKILDSWLEKGIRTVGQAEAEAVEFGNKKNKRQRGDPRKEYSQREYTQADIDRRKLAIVAEMEKSAGG